MVSAAQTAAVISLTARVRPSHEAGSHLIRSVSARLREHNHVLLASGQIITLIPELGSTLISEKRGELVVNIAMDSEDAAARASAALTREVTHAVGSRVSSRHVTITWTRNDFVPVALR